MNPLWRKPLDARALFSEKISDLSAELREILLDDMVTAFENRLDVLRRAHANAQTVLNKEERNEFEILEPQVKKI